MDGARIAEALAQPLPEIAALTEELRSALPAAIATHLLDEWVPAVVQELDWAWIKSSSDRCQLVRKTLTVPEGEGQKEFVERMKAFFEHLNPQTIAHELSEVIGSTYLQVWYAQVIKSLECSPELRPLVQRYHLPAEALDALAQGALAPIGMQQEPLEALVSAIRSHMSVVKGLKSGQGLKTGLRVAASLLGGMVGGRLGARGASALVGAAMSPVAKLTASMEHVGQSWEHYYSTFLQRNAEACERARLLLLALAGGLLTRLNEDLTATGQTLLTINLFSGDVEFALTLEAGEVFEVWVTGVFENAEQFLEAGKFEEAVQIADRALSIIIARPAFARHPATGDKGWAIFFHRLRTRALNRLAEPFWRAGNWEKARTYYLRVLAQPVASAPDYDQEADPEEEDVAWAIWRLALLTTSPQQEELGRGVIWVRQVGARWSGPAWCSALGEALSGNALAAAIAVCKACEDSQIDTSPNSLLPAVCHGLDQEWWREHSSTAVNITQLEQILGCPDGLETPFSGWVRRRRRTEKLHRVAVWGLVSAAVLAIFAGGLWWFLQPDPPPDVLAAAELWATEPDTAQELWRDRREDAGPLLAAGALLGTEETLRWLVKRYEQGELRHTELAAIRAVEGSVEHLNRLIELTEDPGALTVLRLEQAQLKEWESLHLLPTAEPIVGKPAWVLEVTEHHRLYAIELATLLGQDGLGMTEVTPCGGSSRIQLTQLEQAAPFDPLCAKTELKVSGQQTMLTLERDFAGVTTISIDESLSGWKLRNLEVFLDRFEQALDAKVVVGEIVSGIGIADLQAWTDSNSEGVHCKEQLVLIAGVDHPFAQRAVLHSAGHHPSCAEEAIETALHLEVPAWAVAQAITSAIDEELKRGDKRLLAHHQEAMKNTRYDMEVSRVLQVELQARKGRGIFGQ